MQWMTLFKKELLENWRNVKWIWVPLVIILLAILDPLANYYMPQIIDMAGGMPEGTAFELPEFSPADAVMMSLGQLSTMGVLVIVLMSMGTISGERKSGVSELILVKPVSYWNYVSAKWTSYLLLIWLSLFLGLFVSWYYINLLFGELSFVAFIQVVFFYGLWLTFVISLSIFYNTLVKLPGLVAFLTIATIIAMSGITQVFSHVLAWSPNMIAQHIHEMLLIEQIPGDLIGAAIVTFILSILLIIGATFTLQKKELAN
ncbi:ABC transporter permease [Oceanobacillus halotolerans]|uniref:ABC transporter permease n=1 Tax=Oceanobacillus halotolerans TaxID=2663380 RepID=UPI0013DBB2F7|nr:ABC transporter permease subunit [Oceanobacillus halotolerans]